MASIAQESATPGFNFTPGGDHPECVVPSCGACWHQGADCAQCGRKCCTTHLAQCMVCDKYVCTQCIYDVEDIGETMELCDECSTECESCGKRTIAFTPRWRHALVLCAICDKP